jgi:hypothetical protein
VYQRHAGSSVDFGDELPEITDQARKSAVAALPRVRDGVQRLPKVQTSEGVFFGV